MTKPQDACPWALFTDLYELTMARAYMAENMDAPAVFELSVRSLPERRNFLLCAGLADVLECLEGWRFTGADLDYLEGLGVFPRAFLDRLAAFRFTGNVAAVPEGTAVFAGEPLIQVSAPIFQAQLVETLVLNQYHLQCIAATKAARMVIAAAGRTVVDFGSRRAHGTDAALKVARTAYIAGAAGTSNVLAGKRYAIPVFGTMAHSYIQAHATESAAFEAFTRLFPGTTILVDTYDTLAGVRLVVDLVRSRGLRVNGVRLDSGDIGSLAREARAILDTAGLGHIRIFASSDLDEHKIHALLSSGAPIDGFGVGTSMAVSSDAPALDMAYKLVEYDGLPRTKLSASKIVYPCAKQVYRTEEDGRIACDLVCRADEAAAGKPLLVPVMQGGVRLPAGRTSIGDSRALALGELERLPEHLRSLDRAETPYPVSVSPALIKDLQDLRRSLSHS